MSPSPTTTHQTILRKLSSIFDKIEDQSDGLCYIAPMDVIFSDDTILQPDLLYIGKSRRHIAKERIEGPPDLVIEILSPGTGRRDKTEKLDLYAKYAVPEYWVVDPATKVFDFFLLENSKYVVQQQPDDHYRSTRLPEVEINLATFWAEIEKRLPKS